MQSILCGVVQNTIEDCQAALSSSKDRAHWFLSMQDAPKLKVAIVGSGLAGMSTAVELLDQGYEVDIYEQRPFIGGKVASYRDKSGNHIEMGYAA